MRAISLITIFVTVAIIIYFMINEIFKSPPTPEVNPNAPGVHYYEECDYKGWHGHTDEAPSEIDTSFKSVRVSDDFIVKAMSTEDKEVFIKGPSTIKCTEFKSMEVLPN